MRLIYDAQRQSLIIEFRPLKKGQVLNDRREIMPGVWLAFNFHGQLMLVEITQASQHGPELNQFIHQMVAELNHQMQRLPRETLLNTTGPLALVGDPPPLPTLQPEQVRLFYDAGADVLQIETRPLQPAETIQPPQEFLPGLFAFLDQSGQMVRLDIHQGLRHYPTLKLFIDQGRELLAAEKMLRAFGRR